ncbi:hypothetical protein [Caulobacter sp. Root343]|uniref:TipJ family phage tail tip protein n=1 Tax=Caulobacter sp. Root343 TaxID=1736520 RepID=UPI0006FAE350|nr:hypothetical protein [Caulobacter sp. Root343]KQV66646.1 hypothetical protein ASC70_12495 [Caulobacter sp. Root343]
MRVVERCDTAVGLFIARDPSAPDLRSVEIKAGADIAELIAHAVNIGALEADDLPDLRVYVDGEAISFSNYEERAESLDLVPPAGSLVNLQVEPTGGSNSSARLALTIVLSAVAIVSAFTVGAFTAALWQLGAAIVPQLIFPIQTPDRLAGPNDQGGLNSASNTIRRRGQMPLMLGEGRVTLDVAAQAYSVNLNGETWLHVIMAGHYGACDMADVKIGETLLADYPASDIQVEYKLTPGPREFSFYNQSVNQENLQDELDLGGPAEVHTTAEQCERVEIDLTWPQGLQFRKANGSIVQQETRVLVEWAPVGSESYTPAPLEGGPYYARLGGVLPAGTIDVIARTQDPVRRTLAWNKANADQIKIRISAWDPDGDDATMATQATYWTALRSIVKKPPIVDQNLACIALRIKSSDDLGGTLPTVTAKITPHAPVYDADTQTWDDAVENWAPTGNPVAHVRMLLLGPGAAKAADPDEWGPDFGEMYELVEERGWKGGYILATEASQKDALKILGAIGRFSAYDAGEGLVLVPDWEKPVARQLFVGRNVQDFTYTRDFKQACHAVVVEFQNIDEGGKQDEVTVYNTGFTAETATLLETIRFDWQMTGERAIKEGFVFLAKRNVQVEAFEWTAGPSAIASSYGARVHVRHYTSLYGAGEGRVLFCHRAGGLVTGVRLDDEVEMEEGLNYALDVQRYDKLLSGIILITAPGRTRDLMFPSPLPVEDAPMAGDLVAFGKVDVVTEDVEIIDFAPSGDQVRISARKYIGPLLVAAETGEIPEFTTKLTPSVKAPKPRLIAINQANPDGVKIAFDVDEVRGGLIESFPIRWRRSSTSSDENPWQVTTPAAANARLAVTPPFPEAVSAGQDPEAAYKVDVEIRTKLRNGDVSKPLIVANIQVSRLVNAPGHFTANGVKRTGADGTSYPALAVAADAIASGLEQDLVVEIRPAGGTDADWKSAGQPLAATNPKGDYAAVTGGAHLDVRAQWRTSDNWTSEWVVRTNVEIPSGALTATNTLNIGEFTAAQIKFYTELTNLADGNARDALLRVAAAMASAATLYNNLLEQIMPASGRPIGATLDDQVRIVEDNTQTIIEHHIEMVAGFDAQTAALQIEMLVRAAADSALSVYQIDLAAMVAANYATLTSQLSTLTTNLSSTASALTILTTNFNNNVTTVSAQLTALSNADYTMGISISTLTSTTGSLTSSVSIISTTLSTLGGQVGAAFGVRLSAGNKITGFRGINNGIEGGFIFDVDYFGIATGLSTTYPFFVSGSTVYMTNVVISGSLLVLGSVDFAQLATRAATQTSRSEASSTLNGTGSLQTVFSHYVQMDKPGTVAVAGAISQHFPSGNQNWEFQLYIDGELKYRTYGANGQDSIPILGSKECSDGYRLVELLWNAHTSVNIDYRNMTSTGTW